MISVEQKAEIRRLHHAEGWPVGTIAKELAVHHSTVTAALQGDILFRPKITRISSLEPYKGILEDTVAKYPDLTATRLHQMIAARGYEGSVYPVRRWLKKNRPKPRRAYQDLYFMPGESAQVDWADLGKLEVAPRVFRRLQCFVMVLSYSRQIFARAFYDQKTCALLEGHEAAFNYFGGVPRRIIYDNMRTAVVLNTGGGTQFTDSLCDLASHYNFELVACAPRAAWHKGRVERAIRYLRDNFSPATRQFRCVEELNCQLAAWLDKVAPSRPWPEDSNKTVGDVFGEEKGILLPLKSPYPCYFESFGKVGKQSYIRFDCNSYSVPPKYVGSMLTLRSDSKKVKIYADQDLVTEHPRCWSKQQKICKPEHIEQVITSAKARTKHHQRQLIVQRLPSGKALLKCWHDIEENISKQSRLVGELIESYGEPSVEAASQLAIENNTPRADSIAHILSSSGTSPRLPSPRFKREDLNQYTTDSHNLEIYDHL